MRLLLRLLVLLGLGWLGYQLLARERRLEIITPQADDLEGRLAAQETPGGGPNVDPFVDALDELIDKARAKGARYVDINAGALHRRVGGYPGTGDRMPTCCSVMRSALRRGDMVLSEPRSGVGAGLTLRYHLDD